MEDLWREYFKDGASRCTINQIISDLKDKKIKYDGQLRGDNSVRGVFVGVKVKEDLNDEEDDYEHGIQKTDTKQNIFTQQIIEDLKKQIEDLKKENEHLKNKTTEKKEKQNKTTVSVICDETDETPAHIKLAFSKNMYVHYYKLQEDKPQEDKPQKKSKTDYREFTKLLFD